MTTIWSHLLPVLNHRHYQTYCATLSKYPGEECHPRKHQCVGMHICTIVGGGKQFRTFGHWRSNTEFLGGRKKRQAFRSHQIQKPPRRATYKCLAPKFFDGSNLPCNNIFSCPCGEYCFKPGHGKTPWCKKASCQTRHQCFKYSGFKQNIQCRSNNCVPSRPALARAFFIPLPKKAPKNSSRIWICFEIHHSCEIIYFFMYFLTGR